MCVYYGICLFKTTHNTSTTEISALLASLSKDDKIGSKKGLLFISDRGFADDDDGDDDDGDDDDDDDAEDW